MSFGTLAANDVVAAAVTVGFCEVTIPQQITVLFVRAAFDSLIACNILHGNDDISAEDVTSHVARMPCPPPTVWWHAAM